MMVTLNSSKTTGFSGKDGKRYIQVILNGGTATLEIQFIGSNDWSTPDGDGVLTNGVYSIDLPPCNLRITSVTGSPTIHIV